jgi:hypothetical protein
VALRTPGPDVRAERLAEVQDLKARYHIEHHALETLLGG